MMARTWLLVALAFLPFAAKCIALVLVANNYLAQSAYKLFQLAAPVGWRRRVDGRRGLAMLWPIDEPRPAASTCALAIAIAAVSVGIAAAVVPALGARFGFSPAALREQLDARFAMTPWRAVMVVVFLTAINSALEELHFRAWLDPELSRRMGNPLGIATSAAAFGTMHVLIFANMRGVSAAMLGLVFLALAAMGAAWSLLVRRRGGIHAAWLSHALSDAGLLTWGLYWLDYV
jgi:membrane protease YdiL (CAAX protease family)